MPSIEIVSPEGDPLSLSELLGQNRNVVFFLKSCLSKDSISELSRIRDNMKFFNSVGVKVIAVTDEKFSLLPEIKKAHNLNFQMVSIEPDSVSKMGFVDDKETGKAAAVVDERGIISYSEVVEDESLPFNFDALVNSLF